MLLFWGGTEACGILASPQGIKPTFPALEGTVLTTGLPGKFLGPYFKSSLSIWKEVRYNEGFPGSTSGKEPWTEEPGGLQSIGSQRVGHD